MENSNLLFGLFFFLRDEEGHGDSNSIDLVLPFLK